MSSRNIIKNLLSMTAAEGVSKFVVFIYTLYLARTLGTDAFGIFGFATVFASYFTQIVSLGFDPYGAREVAKDKSSIPFFANSIFSVRLFLSIVLFIIYLIVLFLIDKPDNVKLVMLISGVNLFGFAAQISFVFQGIEKMGVIALRQIISSLLNLAGIFLLVHSPEDLTASVAIIVVSFLIGQTWIIANYQKNWQRLKFKYDLDVWKKVIKGSVPIGFAFFLIQIYNNIDIVMLGFMKSDYETGIYNAAHKILLFALIPAGILQNVFFPNLSKRKTDSERNAIMEKFTLITFGSGLFLSGLITIFARELVVTGFSEKYLDTVGLIPFLMITVSMIYISITFSCPLIAWNREKRVVFAIAAGGITNVILNIILIPPYGAYGATYSTIITEFIVFIVMAFEFWKITGRLYLLNFLKLLFFSILSCAAGYFLRTDDVFFVFPATVSVIIFLSLNFLFKTITISELKSYLKK